MESPRRSGERRAIIPQKVGKGFRAPYKGWWEDAVIEALRMLGGCGTLREITYLIGIMDSSQYSKLKTTVLRLKKKGVIRAIDRGKYCLSWSG